MLEPNTSILVKVVSSLFFLVSNVVWKKILYGERKNYHYIFYRVLFTITILILCSFIFRTYSLEIFQPADISGVRPKEWLMYTGLCFFSFWGLYFFTNAIQTGRFSFVGSLSVVTAVFSFLTSLLIYQESLSTRQYIALIVVSLGLLYHQKNELKDFRLSKEVFLTLLSGFFWGISFVFYLIPIQKIGVFNFTILLEICVFISCVFLLLKNEKRWFPQNIDKQSLLYCLLMGLMIAGGSLLSHFTLTQIPVSLNILIAMSFEAIIVAIGLYMFKETLRPKDWIMILIAVGGSLLLF